MPKKPAPQTKPNSVTPEKQPVGRPSKYDPKMCDELIELGKAGLSKEEMSAQLGIAPDTFQEWERTHPEFSVASRAAMNHSISWWERIARIGVVYQTANGPRVDAGLWARSMSARFPDKYREQKEQNNNVPIVVNVNRRTKS